MNIISLLQKVMAGNDLSREEAAASMRILMSGEATPAQVGAWLIALRMKGETTEEITGCAEVMREFATPIVCNRSPLVDTCGTGGDHSGTFNISTTAAFVVAGAGLAVAKHGNRSATSKCGSADVLEHLGVNIEASPKQVGQCIDEVGIGFLFARSLHSAMKHVGPVRAELKVRTVFNLLGPLTNPAGAKSQVMGVFDGSLREDLAHVLLALGSEHVFVVAGDDGLDEVTLTGASQVAEGKEGAVKSYTITPEEFGLERCTTDALKGGDAAQNAEILCAVLDGAPGPCRDIVVLNAALAIVAGGVASTIADGVTAAQKSIDSSAARDCLTELVKASQ